MGCLKLHTENNYITLKVVYRAVNTSVLEEQGEKSNTAFLEVVYRNAQGNGGNGAWYGNYVGPNKSANYLLKPIDIVDRIAMAHDKEYDAIKASWAVGATLLKRTISADYILVYRMKLVMKAYENNVIDPYTNKPISFKTYSAASVASSLFTKTIQYRIWSNSSIIGNHLFFIINGMDTNLQDQTPENGFYQWWKD